MSAGDRRAPLIATRQPLWDQTLQRQLCARLMLSAGRVDHDVEELSMSDSVIILEKVNKWFGPAHVLRDIDLSVSPGEVVVVAGPSGSGKSTMCRTINRLETIDSGAIRVNGRPLPAEGKELANLRSQVGMVFQQFNLFSHLSVLDNVALGPVRVRGHSKAEARERARRLLDRVGIGNQAEKY